MIIQTLCSQLFDSSSGVVMKVAGRQDDGTSVLMNVYGFCPSFYVLADKEYQHGTYTEYLQFVQLLKTQLPTWQDGIDARDLLMLDENEAVQSWSCGNGFQDGKKYKLFKLSFSSIRMYQSILKMLRYPARYETITRRYPRLQVYDAETDIHVKSLAVTGIRSTGWVEIVGMTAYESRCNNRTSIELDCVLSNCERQIDQLNFPVINPIQLDKLTTGLKVMTFDFEVYSSVKGTFPDATRLADCVFQISMVFTTLVGSVKRYLLHLLVTDPVDDTTMVFCQTEEQLFYQFKTIINQEDPDIMTGHNITGFDWGYYFDRCDLLGLSSEMRDFSRIPYQSCTALLDTFKSVQVATIPRRTLYCPGRLSVDFQVWIERNKSGYDNFRLETIAQKELQEGKNDISVEFMFSAFKSQDSHDLGLVAQYCVQDSVLVDRLLRKLNVINGLFAMAYSTNVPVHYLLEKGQTVKANAQLTEEGYRENVLLPKLDAISDSFDGATVLSIIPGIYSNVVCLDFGSLYPSIMITNSICPTTIVNHAHYLDLPHVEYNTINWQKRVFIRQSDTRESEIIFTKYDPALAQFCHDDLQMSDMINKSIAVVEKAEAKPLEEEVASLLHHGMIKDVIAALKKWSCLPKLQNLIGEIRSRYYQCRSEFDVILDLDSEELNDDDDEDDFWTKLREKKTRQKIQFANKSKTKYQWKSCLKEQKYTFAANQSCLTKKILMRALTLRKEVRAKQKKLEGSQRPDDILQYAVYEGQQLAHKVTANSIYGAFALRDYRLGASVTAEGRKMLQKVSQAAIYQFPVFLQNQIWTKEDAQLMIPDGPDGKEKTPLYPSAVEGKPYCDRLLEIKVIGGDTDSIFVQFGDATISEAISWGNKGSAFFSSLFRAGIKMEYEKVWNPYIAIAKKKGIGRKYVKNIRDWTIDSKGVETKKRNYCLALKETLSKVFQIVLHSSQDNPATEEALCYVRDRLAALLNKKIPMDQLLISTKLNSSYKQENLPGLDLVKRMRQRQDFHTPEVGARFQFLYVYDKTNPPKEQYKRSETLEFAQKHNLEPDVVYYVEKQFKNPILGFLDVVASKKKIQGMSKAERLFLEMKSKAEAAQKGNQNVAQFFSHIPRVPKSAIGRQIQGTKRKPTMVQQKLQLKTK